MHAAPSSLWVDSEEDIDVLRARLAEAEDMLRAIRAGEVDALLVNEGDADRVYTLRSADAPYRAMVEQMSEGAVTLARDGTVVYCNRRFASLLNVPLERVIGRSVAQLFPETDRPTLRELLAAGEGEFETVLDGGSAQLTTVQVSVGSIEIDSGQYHTLIVTDLSQLANERRDRRMRDEFLAMLAHELRNPLAAIATAGKLLGRNGVPGTRFDFARGVIDRQVTHMTRLVDDLLEVARVMTGKIVLERRPIDLAQCVRSCSLLANPEQAARIRINGKMAWISGDVVRIEQIVSNLIGNALKFSPVDSVVEVDVGPEGADAVLRVTDHGNGIEPSHLDDIFGLFVQAQVPLQRANTGMGIGLTLTRRLVQLHDGTVDAYSAGQDLGSTFTVRLPALQAPA